MQIRHRVSFGDRPEITTRLKALQIEYYEVAVAFDMTEDDARWPEVRRLIKEFRGIDICFTKFTLSELRAASWLEVGPSWHHGYPMPDDDFGYLQQTYDLTEHCNDCGVGAAQIAPFRMRGEPKWGTRGILQLNWVFDEYFVTAKVWKAVFAQFGIECLPVIAHRTGEELKTVVQLRGQAVLEHDLKMKDHAFEICPSCGRKKYLPFSRGEFPAVAGPCEWSFVRSREWFGSGGSAHRAVLISQALFSKILDARVRGADFVVVADAIKA